MLNKNGQKNINYEIVKQKSIVVLKISEEIAISSVKKGNWVKEGNFIMVKGSIVQ